MSENSQNSSLPGTARAQQLSLPVVSNATSPTGSGYNLSRVSAPAVSSAWCLPSGSGNSLQPISGSAYLYQHAGTTMLSGLPRQSHTSMSAAFSSGAYEWQHSGRATGRTSSLGDVTVMILNQDTSVSTMSAANQYGEISHANAIVPLTPTLPASLVQGTTSQIPHQRPSLSLPYQEGRQVYYYDQNTLGPLLCGELGPCLQSYGSVPYAGSGACAPQPEIVMVLKEIHPTSMPPAVPTSRVYYSGSARCIPERRFQVMENSEETHTSLRMETSPGLQTQSQTFCLTQTTELAKSCPQVLESNPPPESGDVSIIAPVQSPSQFLALPPAPSQERMGKKLDEITTEFSKPLDDYQISNDNQDPLLPLKIPDICDIISSIEPVSQGNTPGSENANLGESRLSLEEQWPLEDGLASTVGSAGISTLVKDVYLPQLVNPLTDLDLFEVPTATSTKDAEAIDVEEVQEKAGVVKVLPDPARKNKEKVSEPLDGAPQAKTQRQDPECLVEGEVDVGSAAASDSACDIKAKWPHHRAEKAATSRPSKAKGPGQEKTKKPRENKPKKSAEGKQARSKVKAEEKPAIPKTKRKGHPPELSQEAFKKPRSSLGMHMLESVQVFHALGRKSEEKTGIASSRALGNTRSTKEVRLSPALKSGLHMPRQGTGPEKIQGKRQKPEDSADTEYSPSQCDLPPPGKVKLVPLPFLSLDRPQARPVPRRPPSLASRRAPAPDTARPPPHSAQPPTVNPSQPAPASTSLMGPTKPAGPVSTSLPRPGFNNPIQPRVSQATASRPAPYQTSSCTSLLKEPVSSVPTKPCSPPKPHTQYLLEDFSRQPIPWRKVDFPGPVVSTPISEEQRPEREAMKRQAQRERENAAKYTALGKVQFFVQREKDMEISRYYGYVM